MSTRTKPSPSRVAYDTTRPEYDSNIEAPILPMISLRVGTMLELVELAVDIVVVGERHNSWMYKFACGFNTGIRLNSLIIYGKDPM